ncbi:MAG: hypothetical protein U0L98_06675 [Clostridia bacterium]|nr:hypothetical protein [Clostridia bacterium]
MKKMVIIIVVLAGILISMIIYKNMAVGSKNNINIQEIQKIEEDISNIYLWKEVTNVALPEFEDINEATDIWIWEVVKKNIDKFEVSYDEIVQASKEIFGQNFNKEFPKSGNSSFVHDEEKDNYIPTEITLDQMEDVFIISDIEKNDGGYEVEIIEYIEDYSNEQKVVVKNIAEEEIGQVSSSESETKIQEIVKENVSRFNKKKIILKKEDNRLIVQKVTKIQE